MIPDYVDFFFKNNNLGSIMFLLKRFFKKDLLLEININVNSRRLCNISINLEGFCLLDECKFNIDSAFQRAERAEQK